MISHADMCTACACVCLWGVLNLVLLAGAQCRNGIHAVFWTTWGFKARKHNDCDAPLVPHQQVWCFGLPDQLGAEMASSRLRVAVAFYTQLLVFTGAAFVLGALFSWAYVLALTTALMWWLGVYRDHQKDDLKHVQNHISVVVRQLKRLQAFLPLLEGVERQLQQQEGVQRVHALRGQCRTTCDKLQRLLDGMRQREASMCRRFRGLSSDVL